MIVPNAHLAVVDDAKLVEYCLNPQHPRGRHKARVFRSRLEIGPKEFQILRDALLAAVKTSVASVGEVDSFGQRYIVDFEMGSPAGGTTVRSAWIIRADEDFPRLSTCYVL
jgi:hypothetical protein